LISLSKLAFIAVAAAQIAIPPLKSPVTDLTGTLDAQQRSALEQTILEFEKRKGAQIAVLMVPSTQPETVEQYAVRAQEAAKVGRKDIDDGVLLVIAKDDRRLHIETGYGLEGVLPDAIAKRIIDEDIAPRFKQNDFYGGIRAGVDRLMRVIEGEPLPAPRARGAPQVSSYVDLIVPGLILLFVVGGVLRAIFGRFLGSGVVGTIAGAAVWAIAGSLAIAVLVGLLAFVFGLFGGTGMRRGYGGFGRGYGGWGGGGLGGGWGGGMRGGGWSGGGGRSGGGGASGSW
jgi:uncharacterized protein